MEEVMTRSGKQALGSNVEMALCQDGWSWIESGYVFRCYQSALTVGQATLADFSPNLFVFPLASFLEMVKMF